jgi:sarcosine oxidase delta subunit
MPESQLIRVTVCARRNPKLSEEEFEDHWKNKHGPLLTSWLKTYGCVKYVQVHFPIFSCTHDVTGAHFHIAVH